MTNAATGKATIVMGVSGVGKATLAQALADRLGGCYIEADDFHPPENISAMAKSIALTDAMRQPWLEALSEAMYQARTTPARDTSCGGLLCIEAPVSGHFANAKPGCRCRLLSGRPSANPRADGRTAGSFYAHQPA